MRSVADPTTLPLLERAALKKERRDQKAHQVLEEKWEDSELDKRIYNATATELHAMMKSKEVTCEQVVRVMCHRAHQVGKEKLNAVTEEAYDEAVARAKEIDLLPDEAWQSDDLPLLGVPISIKDQFHQKGLDTTMGAACRTFMPKEEDGLLVALLRQAGAIPFVRTNVPQCLMLPDCANNVWGFTRNPYDESRTPGGSSGGEGALVAARASPLGLGSDIGGSIRIPSHFCGLTGFKPTPGRLTTMGSGVPRLNDVSGQIVIQTASGPMARSVEDCVLMMDTFLRPAMFDADERVPPIPFNKQAYKQPGARKIGLLVTDNWFQPASCLVRAVEEAGDALRKAGHEVVSFSAPAGYDGWEAARLMYGIMGGDGNMHAFVQSLQGEPLHHYYELIYKYSNMPNVLRPAVKLMLNSQNEQRKKQLVSVSANGGISAREYMEYCGDLNTFRKVWLKAMKDRGLDALVLPGLGLPAFQHGQARELTPACSYTFLGNLLHWPAVSLPVTSVREGEDSYPKDSLPENQRDSVADAAASVMEGSVGLPLNVQVMTLPYRDELSLALGKQLEEQLNFSPCPQD